MYDPSDLKPLLYLPIPKERPDGYIVPFEGGLVWCDDRQRILDPDEVAEFFDQVEGDAWKGLEA